MKNNTTNNELNQINNTNNTKHLQLQEFLTPEFISKYSNFIDLEHLFNESNFKVQNEEDLESILQDELNKFIMNNTLFDSWYEMKMTAINLYVKK